MAANLPASSLLPTIRQRCTSPDAWNKVPRPDAYIEHPDGRIENVHIRDWDNMEISKASILEEEQERWDFRHKNVALKG